MNAKNPNNAVSKPGVRPLRESVDGRVTLDGSIPVLDSLDPMVIQNVKGFAHHHTYGGLTPFFAGLAAGKLMGTRNTHPDAPEKRIWLPPRVYCPDTWQKMEWAEAAQVGVIYSHSSVLYPGAPFRASIPCPLISVAIDGVCTKLMSYLSQGTPVIGMRVKAVFNTQNPTHTILDLSWVPV